MKDKRTYTKLKEHGEDMTHENESKITNEDRGPLDLTLLTEQYRDDLKKYQDREGLYIQTENQLKGAKKLTVQMANTVTVLDKRNQELMKEIVDKNYSFNALDCNCVRWNWQFNVHFNDVEFGDTDLWYYPRTTGLSCSPKTVTVF